MPNDTTPTANNANKDAPAPAQTPAQGHTWHFPFLSGKNARDIVQERHDIVLLFDATNCNPNGDPDTGNMPRLQPDTQTGLVTDVCLKRKIRNFFALYSTTGQLLSDSVVTEDGYSLFVREGAVIERLVKASDIEAKTKSIFKAFSIDGKNLTDTDWATEKPKKSAKGKGKSKDAPASELPSENSEGQTDQSSENTATSADEGKGGKFDEYKNRAYRDAICAKYFDVRYFGQVVSTEGPLKGSFYGQIRGPIQIAFAESLDKILQLDFSITRCAVASEKEAAKSNDDNRTMGRKYLVSYGLYRTSIHVSPAFAAKTGFTYADLDNFLYALTHLFDADASAARPAGSLKVVGLVDFEHQSSLGNAPVHKLFDLVKVAGKKNEDGKFASSSTSSDFPQSLNDYAGTAPHGPIYAKTNDCGIVESCTNQKPENKDGNAPDSKITAHRLIWEITE